VLLNVYGIKSELLFYAPFESGASGFKALLNEARELKESVRDELKIASNAVLFLFAANMIPFKGVIDLLNAASLLGPVAHFFCVFAGPFIPDKGSPWTGEYYTGIAEMLGISSRVRFLGNLDMRSLSALYLASDVFVLPTHKDAAAKVIVEAALAAKPIITTDVHSFAGAIVQDRKNGFIISPGDVHGLARSMRMLFDPELRRLMGERSIEFAANFCDAEKETRGFVTAINSVVRRYRQQFSGLTQGGHADDSS
jgi:glycosyltransferase involved in cell wall biosynthesis